MRIRNQNLFHPGSGIEKNSDPQHWVPRSKNISRKILSIPWDPCMWPTQRLPGPGAGTEPAWSSFYLCLKWLTVRSATTPPGGARRLWRWSEVWFGSSILFLLVGLLRSLLGVLPLDAAGPNTEKISNKTGRSGFKYDSETGDSQDNSDLDLYLFWTISTYCWVFFSQSLLKKREFFCVLLNVQ